MTKLHRYIAECADSHAEHGDTDGAAAITFAISNSKAAAIKRWPACKPAIVNAYAYARQELAA